MLRSVLNCFGGGAALQTTKSYKRQRRGVSFAFESLERKNLLAALPSGFTETRVASALSSPTSLDIADDGRVFIAQQNGTIRIVKNDSLLATPFAKITVDSNGERGLLGITLDPNFLSNGYVYVYYTATSPNSHNRVSRFTADGNKVVPGSEQVLLDFAGVGDAIWRMGGAIHFGPDGKLYISVGDHQVASRAQQLNNPFGKILRINSDGTIPSDNPFYSQTTGMNRAIWALGLRNPYTTAFDPQTGAFFINDVGQDNWEEINRGAAGRNFGWPATEGNFAKADHPNFTKPIHSYSHNNGTAITGGAFYNPDFAQFPNKYVGKYFFTDFGTGEIRMLNPSTKAVSTFATGTSFPTNLMVSDSGAMYYISRGIGTGGPGSGTGQVYKVQYGSSVGSQIIVPPASTLVSVGGMAHFEVSVEGSGAFTYQWQRDEVDIPGATGPTYDFFNAALADDGARFRVVVTGTHGVMTSAAAVLSVTTDTPPTPIIISPTIDTKYVGNGILHLSGMGTDLEDGTLDASQLIWQVDLRHEGHYKPLVPPTGGEAELDVHIPNAGILSTDVWYRVYLTVTDSVGLSTTTYLDVLPQTAEIKIETNVPGISFTLDGQPLTVGTVYAGVVGMKHSLHAPLTQTVDGVLYMLDSWSDGGAATHDITFPDANTTYTANYIPVGSYFVSNMKTSGTVRNGYGPMERDESNGDAGAGDGRRLRLNGKSYVKGLGTHAGSRIQYNLAGKYYKFLADIGIDDEVGASGSVVFEVWGDGALLYQSSRMTGRSSTKSITVDVRGVNNLRLVVTDAGDGNSFDHANWARARLLGEPPPPANFGSPERIPTGTRSHGVATADFNNDGLPDLAVVSSGSNRMSVMLNDGVGGFEATRNYGIGSQPKSVVAADLNGDGFADLVSANQNSNDLSVLLNLGDGTFASAVSYSAVTGAHDVAIADFDGDGDFDLATTGWGSGNVRVMFNRGNGTFTGARSYGVGSAPHSVAAGDFNQDGVADIAVANRDSNNIAVLNNRGNGTFEAARFYNVGSTPHMVRAGDVNGDGRLDLVVVNDGSNTVSVLLQKKLGTFFQAVSYATGPVPKGVAIGDVNGDGLPDIVTANTAGNYPNSNNAGGNTVSVLLNYGGGKFGNARSFTTGRTPFSVVLADFDGDGKADFATANWHTNDVTLVYGQ